MLALRRRVNGKEPMCRDGFTLPLQLERLDGFSVDRVADEGERRLADKDLAGLCGLLEAGGDVDRVAGGQPLLRSAHDLAGVHADSGLDTEARAGHRASRAPRGRL